MIIQVDNTTEIDENNFNKTDYCNKNPTKCFYNKEIGGEKSQNFLIHIIRIKKYMD